MPKPLREYTRREIFRFRPALHWKRELQRRLRVFRQSRAPDIGDRAKAIVPELASRNVLVTVAFNYPDTIAVQGELLRRNVGAGPWLIADNSMDANAAKEINALAQRFSALYVKLPAHLWNYLSPNERHGGALNWVWRSIIKPAKPKAFGFLDHDIYPIAPADPFAALDRFPIAGVVMSHLNTAGRWHLWAGFCFFDCAFLRGRRVDFDYDYHDKLDTSGFNWRPIYRHLDRQAVPDAGWQREPLIYQGKPAGGIQRIGENWVHKSAHSYSQESERILKDAWMRSLVS
jgi:hypothetical protein